MTSIGRTFYTRIDTIVCMAIEPPVMSSGNYTIPCTNLYVPRDSISSYKANSAWKVATNINAVEDMNPQLLEFMKFENDTLPQ